MTIARVYLRLEPNGKLPDIKPYRPFKAVVVLDADYSNDWQDEVSRWLVEGGCLYMMAWGPNCTTWDDSVDYAQISKFLPDETPDDQFVMTTWHDNESLEEVFWYAQFCANFSYDDVEIPNTLIVHIGKLDRGDEFLKLFGQSHSLADRQPEEPYPKKSKSWFQKLFRF